MLFLSYLGLVMGAIFSVAGPMLAGRLLADRPESPDPEQRALEAHALMLLAGEDRS